MSDFERGQWDAFTRVLHLLNTFDLKLVEKGEIYDLVMEMRPSNRIMKQMIVLRKDLNMRKGKMVAQGAHASMKATLEYYHHPYVDEWLNGPFTKIVVGVPDEESLFELYARALSLDIPCSLILDAGRTEFDGVPTYTAVGIGPAPDTFTSALTGHLKLL